MFGFSVSGATGVYGRYVNGFYKKIAEVVNGKPVFINLDSGGAICCWFGEDGFWLLSSIEQKDANESAGCAQLESPGLPHPALPEERWNVANDDATYVAQPEVTVQVASATEVVRACVDVHPTLFAPPSSSHILLSKKVHLAVIV